MKANSYNATPAQKREVSEMNYEANGDMTNVAHGLIAQRDEALSLLKELLPILPQILPKDGRFVTEVKTLLNVK